MNRPNLSLDDLIKNMNKMAGETVVTFGLAEYNYNRIPFTSPKMNYCTYGGLPIGKITEFYGEEHGGKTTTALDIIANYQQMQDARKVLYVDAENTLDDEWATKLGVDTSSNSFIVFQPKAQSAETILDFIIEMVETGEIGLWVLDSVGALFSEQEFEKAMGEKTYAGISGPLTRFSKRIVQAMHGKQCTGIGINQIRDNLNSTWGGDTTPGGHGWRHMCAVRIDFSRGKFFDKDGKDISRGASDPVGNIVSVNMVKTKVCPPKRHITSYSLNYDTGIDYLKDLVELSIDKGIIIKRGAWFDLVNPETGEIIGEKIQGQKNVEKYLKENEEIMEAIETELDKIIQDVN